MLMYWFCELFKRRLINYFLEIMFVGWIDFNDEVKNFFLGCYFIYVCFIILSDKLIFFLFILYVIIYKRIYILNIKLKIFCR